MTDKINVLGGAFNKDEIIEKIRDSSDEEEVRQLTERYLKPNTNNELSSEMKEEIRVAGITKWGELVGLEWHVVGREVRRNYCVDGLIREMSLAPVDGAYRTRSVVDDTYVGDVAIMGLRYGFKCAFNVVFKTGKEMYGNRFTPEMAQEAFQASCNFAGIERFIGNIPIWFKELNDGERGT